MTDFAQSRLAQLAAVLGILVAGLVSPTMILCEADDHAGVETVLASCCDGPRREGPTGRDEPAVGPGDSVCCTDRLIAGHYSLTQPIVFLAGVSQVATVPPVPATRVAGTDDVPQHLRSDVLVSTVLLI